MSVGVAAGRLLVARREEVAAAALVHVDAVRHVEQELQHRRVLVDDSHVQHALAYTRHRTHIITDGISDGRNATVRLSVRPAVSTLSSEMTDH